MAIVLKWMAVDGFVPAVLALLAALACILGLQGNVWGAYYSLGCIKIACFQVGARPPRRKNTSTQSQNNILEGISPKLLT
jgi:hypothetical protein